MADRDTGLTVRITGDASGVISANKDLLASLSEVESKLLAIAEASKGVGAVQTQTATQSASVAKESADAQRERLQLLEQEATARANAGVDAIAMQKELVVESSAAQQKILADMKARFTEGLAAQRVFADEEIGLEKTVDDAKLSMRLKLAEWDRQMNRSSLAEHQAITAEWLEQFEAGTVGAMMVEKAAMTASLTEIKQFVAETQSAFRAGAITSVEQIEALQAAAVNPEYSQKLQAFAAASADKTIAENMRVYDNQLEMNRITLDQYIANIKTQIDLTEVNTSQRILLEKKLQDAYRETAQIQFQANRTSVASGGMTRDQQAQGVLPFLSSPDYGRTVQADAAKELSVVDIAATKEAAKIEEEENKKRTDLDDKENKKRIDSDKESYAQRRHAAYRFRDEMDLLQGKMSGIAYMPMDFGDANAKMIVQSLALVAAFGVAAAAVETFRDSLSDASKEEETFSELGQAISNQGGNWEKSKKDIDDWATALSRATIFSKQEALTALNNLIEKGVQASDAQKLVNVATDVASAKHKELIPTTEMLSHIEGIRTSGLANQDIELKKIIQSHGKVGQAVDEIANKYAGQASAALDTYDGKQKLLQNHFSELMTDFGRGLVGPMTQLTDWFIDLGNTIEYNSKIFDRWGAGAELTVDRVLDKAHDYAVLVGNAITQEDPLVSDEDKKKSQKDADQAWDHRIHPKLSPEELQLQKWANDPIHKRSVAEDKKRYADYVKSQGHELSNSMDTLGTTPKGGAGASPGMDADKITAQDEKLTDVQDRLKHQLDALKISEQEYSDRVADATTSTAKQKAEMDLHNQVARDAKTAIDDINKANKELGAQVTQLTPTLNEQANSYHAAVHAHNAFIASLHGGKATTEEQKTTLSNLNADVTRTWGAYNTTQQAVNTLNGYIEQNTQKLIANHKEIKAGVEAQNALNIAYDDAIRKNKEKNAEDLATHGMSLEQETAWYADQLKHFDQYHADLIKGTAAYNDEKLRLVTAGADAEHKIQIRQLDETKKWQEELQGMKDEEATYEMSLGQQKKYYLDRYNQEVEANGVFSDEAAKLRSELLKLEQESYKQRVDEHKKLVDEITKEETGMLDNILVKHKSFRDDLKTILSDIEGNYIKSFEAMIVKGLGPMNNAWANALSPSGGGGAKASDSFLNQLLNVGSNMSTAAGKPDGTSTNPVYVSVVGIGNGLPGGHGFLSGFDMGGGSGGGSSGSGGHGWSAKTYFQNQELTSSTYGDVSNYGSMGAIWGAGAASILSQVPTNAGFMGAMGGSTLSSLVQSGPLFGGSSSASGTGIFGASPSSFAAMAGGSTASGNKSLFSPQVSQGIQDFGSGIAIGSAIDPSGNQTWGGVGSALGSAAGILTKANPLAGLGLAVGGDLIGALFGPHETAAQTPDTSQPGYQNWLANWQGTTQMSNGNPTFAAPQYDTTVGNQSLATQIAQYINNPSTLASAPAGVRAAIAQIAPLEGSTGSLALNTSNPESQGNFNFASGKSMNVGNFESLVNTLQTYMGNTGLTSSVYNLSRSYPTFTSALSGPVGTYNPGVAGLSPSSSTGSVANELPGTTRTTMNVNIDLSNTNLVGSVPNDVMNQITTKLNDLQNGFIPGAYTTSLKYQKVGN